MAHRPKSRRTRLWVEQLESRELLSADFLLNTTLALDQFGPSLTADGSGNYVATWSGYNPLTESTDIYAQRFDAFGNAVGSEFVVNETTVGEQGTAVVAAADNGGFVVVWTGPDASGGGAGLYFQIFDADGNAVGGDVLVNSGFLSQDSDPAVAMDASGRFVITWTRAISSDTDVYAQMFDADGDALTSAFSVNGTFLGRQSNSAVDMDASGNFVVAYQTTGAPLNEFNIFVRRFDSNGQAIGSGQILVPNTTSNEIDPSIVLLDPAEGESFGDFLVSWTQVNGGSRIQAQRYFGTGSTNGSVMNLTASGGAAAGSTAGVDDYGRWVIGWMDAGDLFVQRFNASNGSEFDADPVQVNQSTAPTSAGAVIVLGRSGGLMAWTVNDGPDGLNVYGNLFFPNTPIITELSGDVAGVEGGTFQFSAAAVDPNDDPISFAWDLDNDGQFDDAFGSSANLVFADDGVYRVSVMVSDDRGNSVRGFLSVSVSNADPSASILGAPAEATVGDLISLGGSTSDPGANDVLTLSWTVTRDGEAFADGSGNQFEFSPDAAGTYVVVFDVVDGDGGSARDTVQIVVAPQDHSGLFDLDLHQIATPYGDDRVVIHYTISGPDTLGGPISFSLYQSMDGAVDGGDRVLATWLIALDAQDNAGGSALAVGEHYLTTTTAALGFPSDASPDPWANYDYYLLGRIDSSNGVAESNEANNDAVYAGVYRLPGNANVFVHGTDAADVVRAWTKGTQVLVSMNGETFAYSAESVSGFRVRMHGGDDDLLMSNAERSVWAWGGDGDDHVEGSRLADVIFGGAGDDLLKGRGGKDLLVGGDGNNVILSATASELVFGELGRDRYPALGRLAKNLKFLSECA